MEGLVEDGDIVICGDRTDTQEIIINRNASLMIVTGGHEIDSEIIEKAKEKDVQLYLHLMTPSQLPD